MPEIRLKDVRAFFPTLFKPERNPMFPTSPEMYGLVLAIKPGSDNDRIIRAAIQEAGQAHFEGAWPKTLAAIRTAKNSFCYFAGNDEVDAKGNVREGYADVWVLRTRRNAEKGPPLVLDNRAGPDGKPARASESRVYSGCHVNVLADIFAYSKTGKGISCGLRTVQFWCDGEAFGSGAPTDYGFEAIASAESAADSFDTEF
jgi:hypothetical protein